MEQLQQAVADQEKKIIEQQKVLRQQQRQAQLAAAKAAAGDVSMTDGHKRQADEEDLNDTPAKRMKSILPGSPAAHTSAGLISSRESSPEAQSAVAAAAVAAETQPSTEPMSITPESAQPESAQPESAQPESAQPELAQLESAQPKSAQAAEPDLPRPGQPQSTKLQPAQPQPEPRQEPPSAAPPQDEFAGLDESIQLTLAGLNDEEDTPEVAVAADKLPASAQAEPSAEPAPAASNLAALPADYNPAEPTALPASDAAPAVAAVTEAADQNIAKPAEAAKDVGNGVEHPLGGPKPDKPKRRKKYERDSVRV